MHPIAEVYIVVAKYPATGYFYQSKNLPAIGYRRYACIYRYSKQFTIYTLDVGST